MAPHYRDDRVIIHRLKCGPYNNNAYLIVCSRTGESVVLDTPPDPSELIEAARATTVRAVLITHGHADHIEGLSDVVAACGALVGIGAPDAGALPEPAGFFLGDGDEVKVGTVTLRVIATPGHTPGSICLSVGPHLFTGDTLFPGGPGKTASPESLGRSVDGITKGLFVLGDAVRFYPGHGDDGDLATAREEYRVFASKSHRPGLCGDVLWLRD